MGLGKQDQQLKDLQKILSAEEKEKAKMIDVEELDQSKISHIQNDTISEKGAQSMLKGIKALDDNQSNGNNDGR